MWLKAADDAQALLVKADPRSFFVPPYVGHKGWVGVYLDTSRVNWSMLSDLIRESHALVAPKRLGPDRAAPRRERGPRPQAGRRATEAPRGTSSKRDLHPMPSFVKSALTERGLAAAYRQRPPYQRNDYIGWITAAKRDTTQRKRLAQMLDELEGGHLYMKMAWHPPARARPATGSA